MENIDLDINNYSTDEIFTLFKLDPTIEENIIVENTHRLMTKCELIKDIGFYKKYILFLKNCCDKMVQYSKLQKSKTTPEPEEYLPNSYTILHSPSITEGGSHEVVKEKIIPTINTYDYKYPAGTLNPIERRTITKVLSVDSLFRSNYISNKIHSNVNNFTIVLPDPIKNVVSMKLISAEIPNFWYTFSSKKKNNTFTITTSSITNGPRGMTYTVTIPDGNYLSGTFQRLMQNYFDYGDEGQEFKSGLQFLEIIIDSVTSCTRFRMKNNENDANLKGGYLNSNLARSADYIDGSNNYSVYDPSSNHYTPDFSYSICFVSQLGVTTDSLNIKQMYQTAGWMLGFREPKYNAIGYKDLYIDYNTDLVYHGHLKSEASYGSGMPFYLFLEVDDFNNNYDSNTIISYFGDDNYLGKNILARLTINQVFNNVIFANNNDFIFRERNYFGDVRIEKLNFRVVDKFGQLVDMNNNDYSLTLEFTCLY